APPVKIPGVNVKTDGKEPSNNASFIAGYLHFENTHKLWEFLDNPPASDHLHKFNTTYNSFAHEAMKNTKVDAIHALFRNPALKDDILKPTLPDFEESGIGKDTAPIFAWVWYTYHLMKMSPAGVFKDSQLDIDDLSPAAVPPEDFHRAYFALCFFRRQKRKVKGGKTPKRQNKPAETIEYMKEDVDDIPEASNTLPEDQDFLDDLDENYIGQHAELDPDDFVENAGPGQKGEPNVHEDPHQVFMIANVASKSAKRRGKLSPLALKQVLAFLGGKCTIQNEELKDPELETHRFISTMVSNADAADLAPEIALVDRQLLKTYDQCSAREPTYREACKRLGLDPVSPRVQLTTEKSVTLKPWQVQGVDFILAREAKEIRGGGLADACGLGKTMQMLMAIFLAPKFHGETKPTLILCPANIIDVWITECKKFFGSVLNLRVYHRDRQQISDPIRKDMTISDSELGSFLDGLKATPAIESRTVVISSYQTWSQRTQVVTNMETATRKSDQKKSCKYSDCFARLVLDEAHHVKSMNADAHAVVQSMDYSFVWFNTATPALNKVSDLVGYLNLIWRETWVDPALALPSVVAGDEDGDESDDERTKKINRDPGFIRGCFASAEIDEDALPVHLLSPGWFRALLSKGDMPLTDCYEIVPKILQTMFLRRSMTSKTVEIINGELINTTIGDSIPSYMICTVDLRFDNHTQAKHDEMYYPLVKQLVGSGVPGQAATLADGLPDKASDAARINFKAFRRLSHSSVTPKMELFSRTRFEDNHAVHVRKWAGRYDDKGFTFFFTRTVQDPNVITPQDNISVACFLALDSPKLQYLCRKISEVVIDGKEILGIVLRWPHTFWLVEMFLHALGIKYGTIHAGMTLEERNEMINLVNSGSSGFQVLVFSFQCGSTGLNLHHTLSNLVIFEVPVNMNTLLQTIGRVHRLGQTKHQKIWILSQLHTFNRSEEYNMVKKMVGEVAANNAEAIGNYVSQQVAQELEKRQAAGTLGEITITEEIREEVRSQAVLAASDRIVCEMIGMAYSRQGFDDWSVLYDGDETDDPLPPPTQSNLLPSNAKATPRKPAKSVSSTSPAPNQKGKGKGKGKQLQFVAKKGKSKLATEGDATPGPSGSGRLSVINEEGGSDDDFNQVIDAPTPKLPTYSDDDNSYEELEEMAAEKSTIPESSMGRTEASSIDWMASSPGSAHKRKAGEDNDDNEDDKGSGHTAAKRQRKTMN
ncbi:hypothetical protein GX51_08320, partial [Blastomyces parvus]